VLEQILKLREAGKVRRCHMTPHHGEYTVGQHCYDMLTLLHVLHPKASIGLLKAVIFHDTHERWTGDMPMTMKSLDQGTSARFQETCERVEIRVGLGIPEIMRELSPSEQEWLKAIDKLDMFLWCQDQEAMGNRHVEQMTRSMGEWFRSNKTILPQPVLNFLTAFEMEGWRRTDERL